MTPATEKYEDSGISTLFKTIGFIVFFIGLLIVSGLIRMAFPPMYNLLIYGILGSLAGFLAVWLFLKTEKKTFASIGLVWEKKTMARFLYGTLTGAIIFAILLFSLLFFSELTIQYHPDAFNLDSLFIYLPILPLALMEEIGFRSYPFVKLNRSYGIWKTQIIIAIAFGAYHMLNGWTVYTSFAGPFVWAFVFGLAALWSKGIAMPTGIHFALNLLQNLTGMKGNNGSVWILDYPPGTSKVFIERTDTIGLMIQVSVLLFALIATAWYAAKNKNRVLSK